MTTIIRMLAAFAACWVIVGCTTTTADMLAKPGGPYGPTGGPDFGLVRYLADGSPADVAAREQDAKRQMYDACNGYYRILRQGARGQLNLEPGGFLGRNVMASDENFIYIKFACTKS
ncbi:MAG: hypothetical protein L0H73_02945 [Nitrococcus sp.]|nr:hypothetical protein [Nitrococcus sp.]